MKVKMLFGYFSLIAPNSVANQDDLSHSDVMGAHEQDTYMHQNYTTYYQSCIADHDTSMNRPVRMSFD
jgi:hypothetical protein